MLLAAAAWAQVEAPAPVMTPPPTPLGPGPGIEPAPAPAPLPPGVMPEITVSAPQPRYVAPTQRDRIGRIWAPVFLDGQGPFRLVLDTGANRSAIIGRVADQLGYRGRTDRQVRVRGVTGTAIVPVARVGRMEIGDLLLAPVDLPIVLDVFGGADGVLGNEGLLDKRIVIDFRRDLITVKRSRREPPPPGFVTLPITFLRDRLPSIDVMIGRVRAKAIIDTGAPDSLANTALFEALKRSLKEAPDTEIIGVTLDVQRGNRVRLPTMVMDSVRVSGATVTVGDVQIWQYWRLTREPAIMLGMDVLGVMDQLIIDYRTRQLHLRTAN
jgi:hypothetical protein